MVDPNKWGPPLWKEMHQRTIDYPQNPTTIDKQTILSYFQKIPDRLPCEKCRVHYLDYLREKPIPAHNRDALINWLIDLHNRVNEMNGKRVLTYGEARALYEKKTNWWYILIILIIILYVGSRQISKRSFSK